jgi:hypothetical protein
LQAHATIEGARARFARCLAAKGLVDAVGPVVVAAKVAAAFPLAALPACIAEPLSALPLLLAGFRFVQTEQGER